MKYPFRRSLLFFMRCLFIAGLLVIFYFGWQQWYHEATYYNYGNYLVMLSYSFILLAFLIVYSGLRVGTLRLGSLLFSCFLSILLSNFLCYLILSLIASEMLVLDGMLAIIAAQLIWALISCWAMNKVYYALRSAREVVAIYSDDTNDEITIIKMQSIKERFRIVGVVDARQSVEVILEAIAPYESVLIGTIENEKRYHLMEACYRAGKRINIIPTPMDIVINTALQTQILDTPVLLCRNRDLTPEQALIKRGIDLFFASIGLIVASPFMAIIALAIKLQDGGPVFYKQKRVTKDGRVFNVLKFRSMIVDAENGNTTVQMPVGNGVSISIAAVVENDDRITPLGRIIRLLRLDELPQIFNILRGDMSIVGPRPERPDVYEQSKDIFPNLVLRLRVKAGLTGYAQIYGRHNTGFRDKLNMDLFYIENYSLLQDIRLIFMTVKILFDKDSSQGYSYTIKELENYELKKITPEDENKR